MPVDQGQDIDGIELGLVCLCGFENFERVIVQRKPHPPIVTDFVACVGCRAMYFAPLQVAVPAASLARAAGSGGGPQPDYKGPLFSSCASAPVPMTAEDKARLDANVARANKSKHKGRR